MSGIRTGGASGPVFLPGSGRPGGPARPGCFWLPGWFFGRGADGPGGPARPGCFWLPGWFFGRGGVDGPGIASFAPGLPLLARPDTPLPQKRPLRPGGSARFTPLGPGFRPFPPLFRPGPYLAPRLARFRLRSRSPAAAPSPGHPAAPPPPTKLPGPPRPAHPTPPTPTPPPPPPPPPQPPPRRPTPGSFFLKIFF